MLTTVDVVCLGWLELLIQECVKCAEEYRNNYSTITVYLSVFLAARTTTENDSYISNK